MHHSRFSLAPAWWCHVPLFVVIASEKGHRARLSTHCPHGRDTSSNGCLGCSTPSRSDTVSTRTKVSHPGQRQEIRGAFCRGGAGYLDQRRAYANSCPKANAICERSIGSARRECLDHLHLWRTPSVSDDESLYRVLQSVSTAPGSRPTHPCFGGDNPTADKTGNDHFTTHSGRSASPLFAGCGVAVRLQPQILERIYKKSATTPALEQSE